MNNKNQISMYNDTIFNPFLPQICKQGASKDFFIFQLLLNQEIFTIQYKRMFVFSYWHAYYDSLFLKRDITPSRFLLDQLQISTAAHLSWSTIPGLPQLSNLFEALQKNIMETSLWKSCFCDQQQLVKLEEKLNNLVVLLHCEKIYGRQYWETDRRRIQASFVHFFIIVKRYLLAILPNEYVNLEQASNKGRIPTNLPQLEKFVNVILRLLKPIHSFMFSSFFQEEIQLTAQLFDSFGRFLHYLPQLKRGELVQTPRLMKFICICNTFQVQSNSIKQFKQIRNKSQSLQIKLRAESPSTAKKSNDDCKSDILVNNQFIKHSSLSSRNNSNKKQKQNQEKSSKYSIFKFSKNLRKNSLATQKKNSGPSFDQRFNNIFIKQKQERQRSMTIKPKFSTLLKSRTFDRTESPVHTPTLRKSIIIQIEGKINLNPNEEQEMERAIKMVKPKINQAKVKYSKLSQTLILETGKSKGWAIIREYVFNRIALKKIKRLLIE